MSKTTTTRKTLQVIATGRVAPYAAGERVERIRMSKTGITTALEAGHRVIDAEGSIYEVVDGQIITYRVEPVKVDVTALRF